MNALFRRDYAYEIKTLAGSIPVRYLGYDRLRKEYVFLEGLKRTSDESQIRFRAGQAMTAVKRATKLGCIGYEPTDNYDRFSMKPLYSVKKSKPVKHTPPKATKEINSLSELKEGDKVKIELKGKRVIAPNNYTVIRVYKNILNKDRISVKAESGLTQTCAEEWVKGGSVTITKLD